MSNRVLCNKFNLLLMQVAIPVSRAKKLESKSLKCKNKAEQKTNGLNQQMDRTFIVCRSEDNKLQSNYHLNQTKQQDFFYHL